MKTGVETMSKSTSFPVKGAASFITSVVVGSMAIIKPFKVSKAPFLRDVIFFAGCVLFTLYTVMDGKITMVESVTLIVYYIFYVAFVVVGNWYHQRIKTERELEERARNLYDDDDEDAEPVDFDEEHGLLNNGSGRKQSKSKDLKDLSFGNMSALITNCTLIHMSLPN